MLLHLAMNYYTYVLSDFQELRIIFSKEREGTYIKNRLLACKELDTRNLATV